MGRLRGLARAMIPSALRRFFRDVHRKYVFRRAVRRFRFDPSAHARPGDRLLKDLIYGWANESWSALDEYLAACIAHALAVDGPILECGSGLSTLLVGFVAQRRGLPHLVLEHAPEWASRIQQELDRYSLNNVTLVVGALKDYGDFEWYDPPTAKLKRRFSLIVCDGPPGTTRGGRIGLVPVMAGCLASGATILLDDAARQEEAEIARQWQQVLGGTLDRLGEHKPFFKLTLPGSPATSSA